MSCCPVVVGAECGGGGNSRAVADGGVAADGV